MKLLAALLLSAAALAHGQTLDARDPAALAAAQQSAQQAATAWLALVDAGQYAGSWGESASLLKQAVSAAQWEKDVRAARMQVGTVQQRALGSSNYTSTLPGGPPGHYVVLQYTTQFTDRANAVETVTSMRDSDGNWRVAGYFVR